MIPSQQHPSQGHHHSWKQLLIAPQLSTPVNVMGQTAFHELQQLQGLLPQALVPTQPAMEGGDGRPGRGSGFRSKVCSVRPGLL